MALALYRKYRPRTFAEVIGQEHVTEPLSQALRSGRLHHAYLFSGPRGCGKTSSARILARSLNCERGPTPEPCGVCASCKSLANDGAGSIDVIEIDAASHGGVDDARDLREKAFFAPASSRYKIYVIDEAHMVSPAGFNALLKLVEEPPDYVKFIFATTEPEKVLGTIKSRTHHYPFRLIPPAVLRPYLQQLTEAEGIHVEPAVFPLVVKAGGGSARDSLSVLDQLISGAGPEGVTYPRAVSLLGVTDVALIDEMCDALAAGDGATAYSTIDRVAEAGHDARRFASDLLERFRDLIILQQVPDAVTKGLIDGPADQLDIMSAQAVRLGPATLSRCADIVHNGLVEMRGTTAPRLLLELITARMLLPGADDSAGALLQRLERMERRLTLSGDDLPVRAEPAPASSSSTAAATPPGSAGGSSGGSSAGSSGGGGLSAARAAAAAAGRRAPAAAAPESSAAPAASAPELPAAPAALAPEPSAAPAVSAPELPAAPAALAPQPSAAPAVSEPERAAAPAASEPELPAAPAARAPEPPGAAVVGSSASLALDEADFDLPPEPDFDDYDERPASGPPADAAQPQPPVAQQSEPPVAVRPERAATRRAEPAGILPDAPQEPDEVEAAAAPGQLSAAAIREVWPEIITAVGRQSKKVAALASGATVRDLEGQTVVLTFRFPAHARMVAAEPELLSNALYEALGGRWQIRCDVAGDGAPEPAPSRRPAPAQGSGERGSGQRGPAAGENRPRTTAPAQSAPAARQREAASPARAGAGAPPPDDDDWPEPARPGSQAPAPAAASSDDAPRALSPAAGAGPARNDRDTADQEQLATDSGPVRPTSTPVAPTPVAPTPASPTPASPTPASPTPAAPTPAASGVGVSGAGVSGAGVSGAAAASSVAPDVAASRSAAPSSAASMSAAPSSAASASARSGAAAPTSVAPEGAASRSETSAASAAGKLGTSDPHRTPAAAPAAPPNRSVSGGLAAARAAAANAGRGGSVAAAPAPTSPATTSPAGSRAAVTTPAANGSDRWADGSPAAEAPYDPEYDGPAAEFEGFGPDDEPLEGVIIDEKTARMNGEQKAVKLLQDAFGAEKIGEI